jgi:hypothetical protein
MAPQFKKVYALNLNISVSAAQKQKLTRIPSVTAIEVGFIACERMFEGQTLGIRFVKARSENLILAE